MKNSEIDINKTKPDMPGGKKSFAKAFLFYFVQLTWGLPVNIFGAIVFLFCVLVKKRRWQRFGYSFICYLPWNAGGLSMGLFIFMKEGHKNPVWTYNTRIHEYGHTWQCLLLGPLYWIVIGLPSAIWCNFFQKYRERNNVSYYKLYCESWANSFGQKFSRMKMKDTESRNN